MDDSSERQRQIRRDTASPRLKPALLRLPAVMLLVAFQAAALVAGFAGGLQPQAQEAFLLSIGFGTVSMLMLLLAVVIPRRVYAEVPDGLGIVALALATACDAFVVGEVQTGQPSIAILAASALLLIWCIVWRRPDSPSVNR